MSSLRARLPERGMTIALLRRGALLWLLARMLVVASGAALSGHVSLGIFAPTALALSLAVGAMGLLDARRRNEHRFLANLGVSPLTIVLLSIIPALVAELALRIAGLQ